MAMSNIAAATLVALLCCTSGAQACQFDAFVDESGSPVPPPPWQERIDLAEVVFVGRVVAIRPNAKPDWPDRVLFHVERAVVKGNVGSEFHALQGNGSDCRHEFLVGQRMIFAGEFIWNPTVYLSDPLSDEQVTS